MELLKYVSGLAAILLFCACIHKEDAGAKKESQRLRPQHMEKPPSTGQDSLRIGSPAAVFFYPDSVQLKKVQDVLDTSVYKAIMHDYAYQMRYSAKTIRESWPAVSIIDARHFRYLLFVKQDSAAKCIDLDKTGDLYGVYLFDGKKEPVLADMPNITTASAFYFKGQ